MELETKNTLIMKLEPRFEIILIIISQGNFHIRFDVCVCVLCFIIDTHMNKYAGCDYYTADACLN